LLAALFMPLLRRAAVELSSSDVTRFSLASDRESRAFLNLTEDEAREGRRNLLERWLPAFERQEGFVYGLWRDRERER
jgi:hypothetical protein